MSSRTVATGVGIALLGALCISPVVNAEATGQTDDIMGGVPDGSDKNVYLQDLGTYNVGSDQIFQTGVVTKVNDALGVVSIGDTDIDYTAALAQNGVTSPAVGNMIAVLGTQPTAGGVILSNMMASGQAAAVTFSGMRIASVT